MVRYIYVIENTANDRLYVGQTNNPSKRFAIHLQGRPNCRALSRAIHKHGKDKFGMVLLEKVSSLKCANEREKFWIAELDTLAPNGYNLCAGGAHGGLSAETKDLLSSTSPHGRKTHCSAGHSFDEENTHWAVGRNGRMQRECRECGRLKSRNSYRQSIGKSNRDFERQKLECKYGHPRTPENTSFFAGVDGNRYRRCKVCHREQERIGRLSRVNGGGF